MSEPLKPCPFCGGEASLSQGQMGVMRAQGNYVECIDCSASSDMSFGTEVTIEAWNKRNDDKYNELVEFLKLRILNGNSYGLTDDMCTKYEDMTFDLQELLRKHGVDV